MKLFKRFGFYLIGVALGSIGVLFFWKQKKVEFDYLPNARVLKNIRVKKRVFSKEAKNIIENNNGIDSLAISQILRSGNVNFDKSFPRKKPCAEFYIESSNFDVYITRCDSIATIQKIIEK